MSRIIIGFHQQGYITNVDGNCYNVVFFPDGHHESKKIMEDVYFFGIFGVQQPTCDTTSINKVANSFGGHDYPHEGNGFDIIRDIGQCNRNIPGEEGALGMLIRDRIYGQKLWYARPIQGVWTASQLPDTMSENNFCGMPTLVNPCESIDKTTQAEYDACMANWMGTQYAALDDDYELHNNKKAAQWPIWVKLMLLVGFGCLVFFGLKKLMS